MKERTGTVNCMIATIIICIIAELIGPLQFKVMGIDVKILTMIWVIIMGILLSPTLLGKVIPPLKKFISNAEISAWNYVWYQCRSKGWNCFTGRSCFTVSGSGKYDDDADCITTWLTPWIRKKCCGWNVLSLQRYGTWYYRR